MKWIGANNVLRPAMMCGYVESGSCHTGDEAKKALAGLAVVP
jgi:hypothetical protein